MQGNRTMSQKRKNRSKISNQSCLISITWHTWPNQYERRSPLRAQDQTSAKYQSDFISNNKSKKSPRLLHMSWSMACTHLRNQAGNIPSLPRVHHQPLHRVSTSLCQHNIKGFIVKCKWQALMQICTNQNDIKHSNTQPCKHQRLENATWRSQRKRLTK